VRASPPGNQFKPVDAAQGTDNLPATNWRVGAPLVLVLAVFIGLQALLPLRTAILIGADEGFEVAKSTLSLKGYKLYADVWNDQPPLHTFLVTESLRHFSSTMLGPRLITSGFALLLLAAVFMLCLRLSSLRVAALATLLLLASPGFLLLGSSCMLEIPALAPTMAALCLLAWASRIRGPAAEIAAGVLLGMALEIKLISLVMLPMAALVVWVNRRQEPFDPRNVTHSLLFLSLSMVMSMVAIDLLVCHGAYLGHFQQSWVSHFGGAKSNAHGSPIDHPFDWAALLRNWDLTLPAIVGAIVCARNVSKSFVMGIPMIWLAYNLTIFGMHRPWWNYYYVHTAIPLCWCAAIGIDAVWTKARWPQGGLWCSVLALYALCAGAWMVERLHLEVQTVRRSPQTYTSLFLKEMERYKAQAHWLYTEEPVYSFHSGIPLPPDLGVVVAKRYWSGEFTDTRLTDDLAAYKPELILLKNDSKPRPFRDLLNAEYFLIYIDTDNLLYVRKAIARFSKH
jgi:hypothetical protein